MGIANQLNRIGKELGALGGDDYPKGDLFESYVSRLFPIKDFLFLRATTRRDDLDGRQIEEEKDPDFELRHLKSGHEFWVECKFRSDYYRAKLEWCKSWSFRRYEEFQDQVRPRKLWIVVGLGGRSSKPSRMFCFPLDEVPYYSVYPDVVQEYERDPRKPFTYWYGHLK